MEQRTAEIIMVCKGQHDFGKFPNLKQAVAAYMSDRCLCPIEAYTDNVINGIIWDAAIDYINSFKEHLPGSFLQRVQEIMERHNNPFSMLNHIDMYEAACIAFQLAQVRSNGAYINGFTEENTQFVSRKRV